MITEKTLTEKDMKSLLWIVDPGHAWLRVPYRLCDGLRISEYSFHDKDKQTAYLEEDLDAGVFLRAYGLVGVRIPTSDRLYEWRARYSLPSFSPRS